MEIDAEYMKLKIYVNSTGSIDEIKEFLDAIQILYNSIYPYFEYRKFNPYRRKLSRYFNYREIHERYNNILPSEKLKITSINVNSPGFWEFLGSLNPLNFIRNLL